MKIKQKEYKTPNLISPVPIDVKSATYRQFAKAIKKFPEEAIYIYSFKENRLVYASGWEETLGFKDNEIDLQTIVGQTDPAHAPFAFDLNDQAVKFILSSKFRMLDYSFTMEINKVHKNGSLVPMVIKLAIYSVHEDGSVKEAIGRFQVNRGLRFGKVIRYASYGPNKDEFEATLDKALFNHIAISEKEKEALSMIAKGFSLKEIAHELKVSQSAIEKRVSPLYKRFNVRSLPHLIGFAYENFILP